MEKTNLKCKDCDFYTGIECHGHGEFFGSCKKLYSFLKSKNLSVFESIVYDDTICKYDSVVNDALSIDNNNEILKENNND